MDVQFQEDNSRKDFTKARESKLSRWLISKKIASDEATANTIQIVVAVIFIVLALIIYFVF